MLTTVVAFAPLGDLGPTVELRGGVVMPTLGLGSSGGCHPDPNGTERQCEGYNATLQAISLGYRSFHDALSYGNQAGVGAAVRDSGVPRHELFLMSMVPTYLMGYNETVASVAASLRQLQTPHLDLVMIHHRAAGADMFPRQVDSMRAFPDGWAGPGSPVNAGGKAVWGAPPCAVKDPTWLTCQDETWRALVELKAAGTLRAIGVSNWLVPNLERMKRLGMELPAVNQVEAHIGYHDDELLSWCQANGVVVQAATPLARSLPALVQPGADPVVSRIAAKHNRTEAQVSLRWLVDKGIAPIPSAKSRKFQQENLAIFDFTLSDAEVTELSKVVAPCRGAPNLGLNKCWADPSQIMCNDPLTGRMFHCP